MEKQIEVNEEDQCKAVFTFKESEAFAKIKKFLKKTIKKYKN